MINPFNLGHVHNILSMVQKSGANHLGFFSNPANSGKFTISTGAGLFPSRVWAGVKNDEEVSRISAIKGTIIFGIYVLIFIVLLVWVGTSPLTLADFSESQAGLKGEV